jgi:hypothetical protein
MARAGPYHCGWRLGPARFSSYRKPREVGCFRIYRASGVRRFRPRKVTAVTDLLFEYPSFFGCHCDVESETKVPLSFECLIWRLRLGRGSMLCAPILHSLGGDSFIRTNNAIDGMAFK